MAATLIACGLAAIPAAAFTVDEHRLLADRVLNAAIAPLDSVTRAQLRGGLRAPWNTHRRDEETPTFASVCATAAADDHSAGRYPLGGRTEREQLEALSTAQIDTFSNRARRGDAAVLEGDRGRLRARVRRLDAGNVVANYLVFHMAACRIAADAARGQADVAARTTGMGIAAGDPDSLLRCALLYEAIALGFLADVFSAGHLMPPPGRRTSFLHPVNRQQLHHYYGVRGLYVFDARGESWQTFGDGLLLWYGPSFDHVFDACVVSLREVLSARFGGGDAPVFPQGVSGAEWLTRMRLAALLRLPAVAVATWSVRGDSLDAHGLHVRHHYPQVRETGGHDPALEAAEVRRLPMVAALPEWMIAPELFKTPASTLVHDNPGYASARFAQPSRPPPSYQGLLVSAGQARFDDASGGGGHFRYGLGYSPAGESPLLFSRMSLDALLLEPLARGGPRAAALAIGFNLKLPGLGVWHEPWLRWLDHARFSTGHAWARGVAQHRDGPRYTAGLESPVLPLRITNAAVALRIEAEWLRFERPRRGLAVILVMQ